MAKKPSQADLDRWRLATDPSYRNPGTAALPSDLKADSAYLAFLRGMGMDYATAQAVALQHIAAARATYATNIQRDPQLYQQERRGVNDALGDRGLWFSGERLTKLNETRVNDQNRRQDFATAQAQGISDAETQLRQQVSALGRSRAEQVGALQGRQSALSNQDRYIAAVRAAAGGGGGGGGGSFTFSGPAPGAPGPAPGGRQAAPGFPVYTPGTSRIAYFNGLTQPQQMQFAAFLHGVTPNSTDPLNTLNDWLGISQGGRQGQPVNAGAQRGMF